MHWLVSCRRQVNDCQTSMAQTDATVLGPPLPRVVGPAMTHRIPTGRNPGAIGDRATRCDAYNAAHGD